MIKGLHREVKGHEFDDGLQAPESRTNAKAGEAVFGYRRIDYALGAELFQEALRNFLRTLVLGDFLTHEEDGVVIAHLLSHSIAKGFTDGYLLGLA